MSALFCISKAVSRINKNSPGNSFFIIKSMAKIYRERWFQFFFVVIICVLVAEFVVYLLIVREQNIGDEEKFILDYERLLCGFKMPQKRKLEAPLKSCPRNGIISTFYHSDFSCLMCQYANVIAGAASTQLPPYIPFCIKDVMRRVFSKIQIPLLGEIGHCSFTLTNSASSVEEWSDSSQSILINSFEMWPKIVVQYMEEVLGHFVFTKRMVDEATEFLKRLRGVSHNVTYIAVYIQNTRQIADAEQDIEYPNVMFFVNAMNEFRKQYKNPKFVLMSDDEAFWRSVMVHKRDVFFFSENSVGNHESVLAVLAHCNHSILSTEGLAIWAALISRGKAIVSNSLTQNFNEVIDSNSDWSYLDSVAKP